MVNTNMLLHRSTTYPCVTSVRMISSCPERALRYFKLGVSHTCKKDRELKGKDVCLCMFNLQGFRLKKIIFGGIIWFGGLGLMDFMVEATVGGGKGGRG